MNKLISINPANNTVLGEVIISSENEIKTKVKEAHAAKASWRTLGAKKRAELLRPLLAAFQNRKDEIITLTTQEMGKTISDSHSDFASDFDYFTAFLDEGPDYIADEITVQSKESSHRIVYEPRGVVAAISPWNYPFSNFIWAVIPNLIAGNTVVFKHSEECPLLGKLFETVMLSLKELPQGVFSEIYGDATVGECLINQNINMIWFTGSSIGGKKIYEMAGKKFIKSVLEMGGSNPILLFEDVDVNNIIPVLYEKRFSNCGQSCSALKRLLVHESIYQEIVDKLALFLKKIRVGDPEQLDTQIGPLAASRQLTLLESQVDDAIQNGAKVVIGGKRPNELSGAYYLPTLLTDIKPHMRVWKEEVFGPVLPIIPFATEEEAIRLANDTNYGLGAHVYSNDLDRARRVASQIEAGSIDINEGSHWLPQNPFGGFKASGMGREHGRHGFQELCQIKVVSESHRLS